MCSEFIDIQKQILPIPGASGNRKIKVKIIKAAGKVLLCLFSLVLGKKNALNALMCTYVCLEPFCSNLHSVSLGIIWRENKMPGQLALTGASHGHLEAWPLLMKGGGFHCSLGNLWSGFS